MRLAVLLLALAASTALDVGAQGDVDGVPAALRPVEMRAVCADVPCVPWPSRFERAADGLRGGPQEAADQIRSPAVAGLLSLAVGVAGVQGVGSYYAGDARHGTRHLLIGLAGVGLMVVGFSTCDGWLFSDCGGGSDALIAVGGGVYVLNLGWSTVVAVQDARDYNARRRQAANR